VSRGKFDGASLIPSDFMISLAHRYLETGSLGSVIFDCLAFAVSGSGGWILFASR